MKPGRPRKTKDDKRSHTVSVRLSSTERATLAGHPGPKCLGTKLRNLAWAAINRRQPAPPKELPKATAQQFAAALSNLNQLAKMANSGQSVPTSALAQVADQLLAARTTFLGEGAKR